MCLPVFFLRKLLGGLQKISCKSRKRKIGDPENGIPGGGEGIFCTNDRGKFYMVICTTNLAINQSGRKPLEGMIQEKKNASDV